MESDETAFILERYNKRLLEFGYSPRTLGWPKARHRLRYHILLEHWNITGKRILDFGCGSGDMYGYMKGLHIDADYEGVDINENLIRKGFEIYPEAELRAGDFLENGLGQGYDYVFSSGVHNVALRDNWAFVKKTFAFFDRHAGSGFALNFLSDKVQYAKEESFHADPAEVLRIAYQYSNRVVLRNDYMPFEFTVFVDKRTEFDSELVVYPEFLGAL